MSRHLTSRDRFIALAGHAEPMSAERIATHEAAHAVAALALGIGVDHLSIDPEYGSDGEIESLGHIATSQPFGRLDLEALIQMTLAGQAAERRRYGVSLGHGRDEPRARLLISALLLVLDDAPAVDGALGGWQAQAAALVDRQWPWVLAVAGAAQEKRTMTGDEISRFR